MSGRLGPGLVVVALMGAVIGSVGAPLITAVATGLHVPLEAAQWTLTITLFTGAIVGPVLGRLGSGPHRRAAILVTLALVAIGGALTALPLPFAALVIGRGLQGLGVAVVALLMSVARTHLPPERSATTIAALSVASTAGIGVGYPLIGLLDQLAGLRAAYALGFVLSAVALVVAWRVLPREEPGERPKIDVTGALLLGAGTLGVLLVIAEPSLWRNPWLGASILAGAIAILAAWAAFELRTAAPLVDLRLLGQASVLRANAAMLVAGIGTYLLFSLLTRYVQTPADAGYGFALPGVAAGAALIPFSAFGFFAGKVLPARAQRRAYPIAAAAVVLAALVFAAATGSLVVVLIAMAVLGFGVGGISAVMPKLVLAGVPQAETASVLSINQIVRSTGFSIGSALAGLLLAAATPGGALLPAPGGYVAAALWSVPLLVMSALIVGRRTAG
ncbi:Predicted arabinose efflux permease, MFS family [Saccharopolyspora kobensis]|uniref:Predicted arabinose efflux permease, MFS family n=1 Tax=Saccharopolyspora kobensis TaxID=146035 RepID=A0A1H6CCA6_9PSEU|nr:MFS transporter [Saccharopolyspora kobensis]SEG70640.1 Predicted arabinose efflux permease, MFS family [Saccharopolyspora kobensis]SFC35471.1 Predicted arabinose efflux permease, MFS family [Saccharopolyspora kobensis]